MSRHSAKRADHRRARLPKRPRVVRDHQTRIILCLWSANGDPIARFEAWGNGAVAPSVCVHDHIRYDKVERQQEHAKIVHYQTRTLVLRVAA